ncbi:uncharacterized protein LOC122018668 [Zingiber officinale]|uniref:uncharacterized protein LOC122018668 n=1 Tax=Zingiber officinale TaxID=94328 RepID=UPI001C4D7F3D|nr:uncharacterized protein LOC122018668 [Zingiber officinale]
MQQLFADAGGGVTELVWWGSWLLPCQTTTKYHSNNTVTSPWVNLLSLLSIFYFTSLAFMHVQESSTGSSRGGVDNCSLFILGGWMLQSKESGPGEIRREQNHQPFNMERTWKLAKICGCREENDSLLTTEA